MQKINIKNLFRLSLQNEVRPLHFVLANRGKEKLGEIDNVFNVKYTSQLQTSEVRFIIYKTVGNKECRLWDEIISRRLLWVKEYGEWFEITVNTDDSEKAVKKTITATALYQAELSNINMDNTEINTDADIERTDYEVCTFYNPEQPNTSILHRLLKKVPNYTIKHVDDTLHNIQRSFSISDNTNIYDFLTGTLSEEIGCLFLFDSNERGIYVYDMQTTCLECGHRDEAEFDVCPKCGNTTIKKAYGDDTTIFVSKDNLGEGIQLTSNANEVKNCYKISGGDDIINAAIINSNPNGTNTIYAFDEDTRRDMSVDLVKKLDSYNTLVEEYKTSKKFDLSDTIVEQYNSLISKINNIYPDSYTALNSAYTGYSNIIKILYNISDLDIYLNNGMMPTWEQSDKTAQSQISLIESELTTVSVRDVSVISKSTADNAVLLMVKAIIDSNIYKAEIINSTLSSQTWTGQIKLTNYCDEAKEDVATSRTLTITINDDMVSFVKQRIQKETAKIDTLGVSDVLTIDNMDEFKIELKKYCLASLKGFLNAYQTVLDVLIEENMSNKSSELYDVLYLPYYNKLGAIENEISVRESDIEIISALKDELQQIINNTHEKLDFENYLGEDLWNVFLSYRREDNYTNEHYISDGLTNDEVIAKAEELIEVAYKELIKSSSKQYTISATLHNLLLIVDEEGNQVFAPILDDFTLGNFIRCKIDGVVYKMRIMDVTIDYDNLNKLSITFGDVSKGTKSIVDKMSDVIKQTNSIAASYSAVKKQAKQGETANYNMEKLRQEGLNSAQYNVFNTNSTFIMDEHGLLGRNYDDVNNQFSLEQLRINGSNIILSSDGGKSTDLAVGKQTYTIDSVQYEDYCVNAKTVIGGKVIAGDIFSANYTTDENGNIIKGNHFGLEDSSFELADGKMIYDNSTNTLKLKDVTLDWNTVTTPSISNINGLENELNNLNNSIKSTEEAFANEIADYAAQFNGSISDLQNQIDGNITTWFYDGEPTLNNSPANEWTAVEDKNRHLGDLYYDNLTGYAYRFQLSGTIYFWVKITDSDVTKALADAKNAQDTADNKRRVFVTTPIPPYDIGDLWVQGEDGELMKCIKTRTDKETFSSTDWAKASKYTDDSALHSFVEGDYADDLELINQQIDKKSETWYQNTDPSVNWTTDKLKDTHVGDLWFNIDENKSYIYISSHSWQEANGVPDDVYDKIDGKAQIFSSQPTTPYYEGDLYVQGVNGDIYVCQTERLTGNYSSNDWVLASKYTDDTELYAFINGDFKNTIDAIKSQSDQKAETWYQETDPSLNWSTEEKQNHVGDLWYSINNEKTYIWNGLSWDETKSTPPSEVFDEIDGKAQIFINQPNPPYKEGDLWFNGESSDIMTCIKSKLEGTFASSDWEKRNKYTDDSALTNFINGTYTNALKDIGTQIDRKARSWYQSTDPSLTWDENEDHEGDLWYNTSADSQVTSIYQDNAWKVTSVPKSLFDTIDGIASIYITVPENPVSGDLLIPTSDIGNYKTGKVYRYNGTTWIEISYTDDTKANEALDAANKAQTTADSAKSVADNAKIIGDNLVNVLGYDGTKITGTYIYSPVISGGTLLVGNKNGTYAEITTDGVLNCAGANFQGSITGGDININNRFIVSSNGDVTLPSNATITWGQVTDSPTIPSAVSDLENDLNFATKDDLDELLDNLPEQSDAGVDTYYQETQPYDNYPSETEINAELEDKVGDIWFNTVTRKTYQYIRQNSETQGYDYYWKEIVAIPDDVYDKIDGKAHIFTEIPTPPYHKGDLWFNDNTSDIMVCIQTNLSGTFSEDEWEKRDKYTDDTLAQQALDEATQAIKDAANGINLAKTAQARAEEAEANAEDYAATAQTNAEKYAKDYADTQDNTLSTNLTTAYENYTDSKISDFDNLVAKYLGLSGNTLIGNNYIISPIIQGGYANITNSDNGSRVIIDPNNLTGTGYIFQVHNGSKVSVGVDKNGNAMFQGAIYADEGNFGGWVIDEKSIYCETTYNGDTYTAYLQNPSYVEGADFEDAWVYSVMKNSTAVWKVTPRGHMYCADGYLSTQNKLTDGTYGKGIEISGSQINLYSIDDKDNLAGTISVTNYVGTTTQIVGMNCDMGDELHFGYKDDNGKVNTAISINEAEENNGIVEFHTGIKNLQIHKVSATTSANGNASLGLGSYYHVISAWSDFYFSDDSASPILTPYFDTSVNTWKVHVTTDTTGDVVSNMTMTVYFLMFNKDLIGVKPN